MYCIPYDAEPKFQLSRHACLRSGQGCAAYNRHVSTLSSAAEEFSCHNLHLHNISRTLHTFAQREQMEIDIAHKDSPSAIVEKMQGPVAQTLPVAYKALSRAELLKAAFDKVLEYGLKEPSREEFGGYFPSMDTALVDALYDAYQQAVALVRFNCQEEYQVICAEHHLLDRLQSLDKLADESKAVDVATATPLTRASGATPGRKASSTGLAGHEVSEAVVHNAERIARRYALCQEAAHLQDMLEKARRTENRLSTTLPLRQEAVDKLVATYQRVVTDVKQVYDITRAWPTSASPNGTFD